MKNPPSQRQIDKEITTLESYVDRVRPKTVFGDSNVDAINAQIQVLDTVMEEGDIWNEWPEDQDEHTRTAALEALLWVEGNESEAPSKAWETLLSPKPNETE